MFIAYTSSPSTWDWTSRRPDRILIYVGTLFLMVGIVVMSNCSWTMQVTLGVSYLVLNVIYMFCALTPEVSRLWHWGLRLIRSK